MNNIIDILQSAGIPYKEAPHRNVRRGWIGIDCPKCSPGHGKFRLGLELMTLRAHCWSCGGMYAPDVLAKLLRVTPHEASQRLGFSSSRRRALAPERTEGVLRRPTGIGEFLPAHLNYLRGRGFDPAQIAETWGVQGIGPVGRLKWRLYIPIFDRFGLEVSWTTRSVGKENAIRYWSAMGEQEVLPHKSLLYGAHLCRHVIVVCEGAIDVWAIGPGAVATCGVGFSEQQRSVMTDFPFRVICFDTENDAQRRARQLCGELSLLPGHTENVVLESGKDAADADPAEIRELRLRYFPELYAA